MEKDSMLRLKSEKQLLMHFTLPNYVYHHFDGTSWNVFEHHVKMPRKLGLWLARYNDDFSVERDLWEFEDTEECERNGHILLVRSGGLGDLLLLTPLIRFLNRNFIKVTLATSPKYYDLFQEGTVTLVDIQDYQKTLNLDDYDAIVALYLSVEKAEEDSSLSQTHRAQAFADVIGVDLNGDYDIDINTTTIDGGSVNTVINNDKIVYVWGSSCTNRNWSREKHLFLLSRLSEHYKVTVVGDEAIMIDNINLINATGDTSLLELFALIKNCSLVIAPDTGVFHIARAFNKPTISYFGAFPYQTRLTGKSYFKDLSTDKCCDKPCRKYECPFLNTQVLTAPCIDQWNEEILQQVYAVLPP